MSIRARLIQRAPEEIETELNQMEVDSRGAKIMVPKGHHLLIKIDRISPRAAIILKQEALALGAEAALPRETINRNEGTVTALLMGTEKQLRSLKKVLAIQPFGLAALGEQLEQIINNTRKKKTHALKLGKHTFPLGARTLIMGILNVTPDSFSDGGRYHTLDTAVQQAHALVEEGADIVDIGGESTRPGAVPISRDEELSRLMPVLEALLDEITVPVSVDTYKSSVAEEALKKGAHMINDVWAFRADPEMADVVARHNVPVCLMHNREVAEYQDLMGEIIDELQESVSMALDAGISKDQIILDPGIGFGKNTEHNLEVMHRLEEFKGLGYPLLLGTSRKSLIGNVLQLPKDDRVEGTAATVSYGITRGAEIVRVHDVKPIKRIADMTDAMVRR